MSSVAPSITELLQGLRPGERSARFALLDATYARLHGLISSVLRRKFRASCEQTTDILNEVAIRLIQQNRLAFQNSNHYFHYVQWLAERVVLKRIQVRRRQMEILAANPDRLQPSLAPALPTEQLEQALQRLELLDARQARMVRLRYITGLSEEATAAQMETSVRTVRREVASARLWLQAQLTR